MKSLEPKDWFPSKRKYVCKRNKGDHVLVWVKPTGKPMHGKSNAQYQANLMQRKEDDGRNFWNFHGANIYVCSKCGHIEWKWLDKDGKEKI